MTGKPDLPDNQTTLDFPSPEQMRKSAEEFVNALEFSVLSDFINSYPTIPREPGLYAVMAPDEIMVKVVEPSMGLKEIRRTILHDVAGRMLRGFYQDCVEQGMSFDRITDAAFPRLLAMKKLYRLEKLQG